LNGSNDGSASKRTRRVGVGSISLLLLGALLVPLIGARAGATGGKAETAIQATASGRMTLKGVWTPQGNRRSPRVKMSALPTIDPADYQEAKDAAEQHASSAARGVEPKAAPSLLTALNNIDGTNFANSNGTGVSCGCHPPDTNIAAGTTQVFEAVNKSMDVYSRGTSTSSPSLLKRTSAASFFKASSTDPITDPRVVYDPLWNRFVALITRRSTSSTDPNRHFFLAASKTASASGAWFVYTVTFGGGPFNDGDWIDYPGLALDQDAIVVTGNVFDTPAGGGKGAAALGIAKARAYNGLGFNFPIFTGLTGTLQPNMVLDQSNTDILEAFLPGNPATVRLYSCTEFEKPGATSCVFKADVNTGQNLPIPPPAPQPGTTLQLDTLDARFENRGVQYGSTVWQANGINFGGPAGHFFQIDTSSNSISQQGTFFGSGTSSDFNVSISANTNNEVFLTWTSVDSVNSVFPQVRFSGRQGTDAAGTIGAQSVLFTSPTSYSLTCGTCAPNVTRWGDYSYVALDPKTASGCAVNVAGGVFRRAWLVNEKVESNGTWGSRIGQIGFC
jgi:hypothetical protein